ncbi:hypothetical protein [Cyanobium sp. ATX 6F1]|uniref:hypothetical protein n=1 Tax=unclassified Cyanobium TaxID=2627006 RepID=UPI0020CC4F2B|nr:hypothetical protein [Cyanobium sp. ATX 6F1]MCP9916460.1 hypothetical protein [Cyanobium sp. ATX 6F1]
MRTTLTVDDQLLTALKQRALEQGKPFRTVVEATLRAGLSAPATPAGPSGGPYQLTPVAMGAPRQPLERALALADRLEEDAIAAKLAQRR